MNYLEVMPRMDFCLYRTKFQYNLAVRILPVSSITATHYNDADFYLFLSYLAAVMRPSENLMRVARDCVLAGMTNIKLTLKILCARAA